MSKQSEGILQKYSVELVKINEPMEVELAQLKQREDAEYGRCRSEHQANKLYQKYNKLGGDVIRKHQERTLDARRALRKKYQDDLDTLVISEGIS